MTQPSSAPAATGPASSGKIARGGRFRPALLWSYVLSTGTYAITALMTFILAAILGPEEFGVLWMAIVWVTLAQILLQHGPTMAVIQQEEITDRHLDAAFWSTLVGATVFAAVLAGLAPLWAAVNRLPELTAVCLALVPIIPLYALNVIPEALLRRRMLLRGVALRYLTSGLIAGVAGVVCAVAGLGVWALVIQQVGTAVLATGLLWLVTPWRPRMRRVLPELRDIRGTSLKTLAGALGNFLTVRVDVLLMGALFGPVVVGLFRFAVRFPEMVVDVTSRGLQSVSLPELARHGEDPQALADRLTRLAHAGAVFSIPTLGVLAAAAEPLVLIIGDQWAESIPPLRILCLVSVFLLPQAMFSVALQAAQRPGLPAAITWVAAAALTVAILAAAWASTGAGTAGRLMAIALAMLAVQAPLAGLLGYLTFRRVLRVPAWPTLRPMLPSLLAATAALGTGMVLSGATMDQSGRPVLQFVVTAAAAGAVAVAVLLSTDAEVRSWLERLRRVSRARAGSSND